MRKPSIFIILFLFLCPNLWSQRSFNGVYKDNNCNIVCIKDDSIAFCLKNHVWKVYYGRFSKNKNGEVVLFENEASVLTTFVEKTRCDENYIEIELFEWYHPIQFGSMSIDTVSKLVKSNSFIVYYDNKKKNTNDTLLRFSKSDLFQYLNDEDLKLSFVSSTMTGFCGTVVLPLNFGTKYSIIQKYDHCVPLLTNKNEPTVCSNLKLSRKIFINKPMVIWHQDNYLMNDKGKTYRLKRVGDCESCLKGLRYYYPKF